MPTSLTDTTVLSAPAPTKARSNLILALRGLLLAAAATGMFFATTYLTRHHLTRQQQLASEWFEQGENEFHGGHPEVAVVDYRTALAYSRDNSHYLFRLAEALAAAGRLNEARAYFLSMYDAEPGDGQINLELARVAVRRGDMEEALRFFHGAIYGLWTSEAQANRLEARTELVQLLLQRREYQQARSELLAMAVDLPRDTRLLDRVAVLFSQASDYQDALDLYRRSLALDAHDLTAWRGAGEMAFKLGDYRTARKYLAALLARAPGSSPEAAGLLQVALAVLELDPYAPELSSEERNYRIVKDFKEAGRQLQECTQQESEANPVAIGTPLQTEFRKWSGMKSRITAAQLNRNSELADSALAFVTEAEQTLAGCKLFSATDQALALIFRPQQGTPLS